jgi:HEAT repeat protein
LVRFVNVEGIKAGIVRALTAKEARGIADTALVAEFRAVPPSQKANLGLKWTIGNALSVVATDAAFADLVELLRDKRNGRSREMLAVALGNMKDPAAVDVLIELLNDEEVAGHALMALGKLKAQKARPHIESFLNHQKPWVRKEAKKALAKLNK